MGKLNFLLFQQKSLVKEYLQLREIHVGYQRNENLIPILQSGGVDYPCYRIVFPVEIECTRERIGPLPLRVKAHDKPDARFQFRGLLKPSTARSCCSI